MNAYRLLALVALILAGFSGIIDAGMHVRSHGERGQHLPQDRGRTTTLFLASIACGILARGDGKR